MNWTASLLRNQLKKEKIAHQTQLNFLASTSKDAESYLLLEQKVKGLESNLAIAKENLTKLKNEVKNTEKLQEVEVKELELKLSQAHEKLADNGEVVFNLKKEIRTNSLYYQQELRKVKEDYQVNYQRELGKVKEDYQVNYQRELGKVKEDYQVKLTKQISQLGEARAKKDKVISSLAETKRNLQKELQGSQKEALESKKELDFAKGKLQALEKILQTQIVEIIRKNIIFRKSKELKIALQQVKELMGWESLNLPETAAGTSSNTPAGEAE